MASGRITKRAVDAMAAADRDAFLWDDELRGFGLKITPSGAKSYVYQFRMGGREAKTQRYTIGTHGSPWTPATARDQAERLALMVAQGINPVIAHKERRQIASELEFCSYASRFLAANTDASRARSYEFAEGALRLHVAPVFAGRLLPDLRRADVVALLDRLPPRSVALRRNVYSVIRRLFRWAVARGDLERSPLDGMEVPPAPGSRDRVLDDRELLLVWRAAESLGFPFGPFVHFLIVTGQRREEVAGLNWKELDRDARLWTLPAERVKHRGRGGNIHLVPLNELAVGILDELTSATRGGAGWPRSGLVFSTTGSTPISGYSRAKARLDREIAAHVRQKSLGDGELFGDGLEPWRLHDLRRTFATGMQRLGVRFEVTEALLNHVSGSRSGVAGVYQRHDWREEKRAALDAWARHIAGLLAPANETNVVQLATRA